MVTGTLRQLAPLILVAAAGCSNEYTLRAVVVEGRLAFVPGPSWFGEPECIDRISVTADEWEPVATPSPEDDESLVLLVRDYWNASSGEGQCENRFPILYGARLEGSQRVRVAAKPLRTGSVYAVRASHGDSSSGVGWFKILPNGRVETYPADPTPTWLDEDGWQINAG